MATTLPAADTPPAAPSPGGAPPSWPAGPRGHPLLGHLPHFRRDPLGFLTRSARAYGDFVPLRFLLRRVVFLNRPEYVESVLVTERQRFIKSQGLRRNRRLLGNGLLTSDGDFWRRQRRLMQPAFHRQRIAAYAGVMVDHAERLAGTWRDGEVRDVHEEMMRLTLEIVGRTLFGADVSGEAASVGQAMHVALECFGERTATLRFLLPENAPTPGNLRFERAARQLDAVVYRLIDQRRRSGDDPGDLLSMLLHARDEGDGSGMTDQQVRDEAMTLFLAGHETTAIALSWTWYLLSRYPDVETKLHQELASVLGGRAPALADLPRLPYVEAVIQESMRLYPPAWVITRQAAVDCQLGEHRLPAGTVVLMSQWVMHHDPRYYDDPQGFHPERWLNGLAKRLPRFAYFPFGGGPRLCIGHSFATMEAHLLLATIAQRYAFRHVPGHPVVPWPVITLRPRHGVKMTLHRR